MLRGHLDCRGPSTVADLAQATGLRPADIGIALARLEDEGFAIRGRFTRPGGDEEYCSRRLLARIHAYTRQRQRREIEPVTARDFMRFLLRWQHLAPGTQSQGRHGAVRKQRPAGETIRLSAADPLNLTSIVLPGPRIPAIPANSVTYLDGAVAPGTASPEAAWSAS